MTVADAPLNSVSSNSGSLTSAPRTSAWLTWARRVNWCAYGGLLLGFSLWQLTRPGGPVYFLWFIQLLPLLIFLPGLRGDNPRSYIGLCFVLLLYFIKGVEGVFSPARGWVDYLVLTLSVVLFISAMLTSRWLQQAHNRQTRTVHGEPQETTQSDPIVSNPREPS